MGAQPGQRRRPQRLRNVGDVNAGAGNLPKATSTSAVATSGGQNLGWSSRVGNVRFSLTSATAMSRVRQLGPGALPGIGNIRLGNAGGNNVGWQHRPGRHRFGNTGNNLGIGLTVTTRRVPAA